MIIVADRGMYSRANLEAVGDIGFEYIVGTKLKNSDKKIKELVLSQDGYNYEANPADEENSSFKWKKIVKETKEARAEHQEKIIVAWSAKRAKKDLQDRGRLIEKAIKLASSSNINDKRGGKKYLKIGKTTAELDREKIAEDSKWDGYYGISTNSDLKPQEVLSAYHNLWRIEDSFRLMKSYFETRPMFHWTEKRISGHIMLNFIA
ncbi:MAG: hypothetical protein EBX50_22905 [Chitinophagia bacterium]|nr:hypothetical protein [Chitinophagia bacterium]